MKLNRSALRKMIIQELNKMKEDSLRHSYDDPGRDIMMKSKRVKKCHECGSNMLENEKECYECGASSMNYINEGCGCGTCAGCESKGKDYSLDFLKHDDFDLNSIIDIDSLMPDMSKLMPDLKKHDHDHSGNEYMSKPSLYKTAKYAQKLLQMIPDGYELADWQRTKIAQIADDISEVYHSIDYDKFQGDL